MGKLKVGDLAPDFTLPNQDGKSVTLSEVLKKNAAMLVFYPKDDSPVCTTQLCSYQDSYDRFLKFGITILGISGDSTESHKGFSSFSFDLLSDSGKKVAKQYGAGGAIFGGRGNFIVGKDGKILYEHVETVAITHRKPAELLKVLEDLKQNRKI